MTRNCSRPVKWSLTRLALCEICDLNNLFGWQSWYSVGSEARYTCSHYAGAIYSFSACACIYVLLACRGRVYAKLLNLFGRLAVKSDRQGVLRMYVGAGRIKTDPKLFARYGAQFLAPIPGP